ncbi:hypothetical protein BDW59DRAFT_145709 [Aspergillus cavernicola]|uniref:Ubiquitin-like protease family profile domain-containing protein n=1 Tax=Aspergillus cavernicola TaxID=176166 RepID=A0ABR4IGF3_9EURO
MQVFKTISDHLFSRPPQPPSDSDPPVSSDAASEVPVRLPSLELTPFDPFTQHCPSHSYANGFRPDRKPSSVRRLLRQSIPHLRSGMPHPSREGGLMHNNNASADEARLFPGSGKPDPNAVQIVPGQTLQKRKQNIPPGPRPYDFIGRGARDSGPVRARGQEREPTYYSSQARSPLSPPRPNHAADPQERSSKRRRVENPAETAKVISISDDDGLNHSTTTSSPVAARSTALSPTPSQLSSQVKMPRNLNGGQDSPYRSVDKGTRVPRAIPRKNTKSLDRFSSEDQDLHFTRGAAEERRRESFVPSVEPDRPLRKLQEQTSNPSVEIPTDLTATNDNTAKTFAKDHAPTIRESRTSIPRESPDELQGEVTVRPVPTSLNDTKISSASNSPSSDIRPTEFTPRNKRKTRKNKKEKSTKKERPPQSFRVFSFRGGAIVRDVLGGENDKLIVDPANRKITISVADAGYVRDIPFRRVLRALAGDASSRKLRLELSKVSGEDFQLDIELSSPEEKACLCCLVQDLGIEAQEKPGGWIDKAFNKGRRDHMQYEASTNGYKRPLVLLETTEENPKPTSASSKRVRLSDGLKDNDGNTAAQTSASPNTASGKCPSPLATKPSETLNSGRASTPSSDLQHSVGVEIPVKKSTSNPQATVRATRSMSRQKHTTLICDDDDHEEDHMPQPIFDVDNKWNRKPLVYPRYGKKKAEVNGSDLERLAPHQFLNDNIIGLYIRFLEDHLQRCNAEVAKRVYFFNSYFFATLTNSPRGKRSINYEGVEKWTRNVDLFSYDYIVVPINEDAHWYIAIICNLPYLQGIIEEGKSRTSRPPSEVREVPETPETSQPAEEQETSAHPQSTKEETVRQSLASTRLIEKQEPQVEGSKSEEWPECENFSNPSRTKNAESSSQLKPASEKESGPVDAPKKPRKLPKKPTFGRKYDVYQPIVVTFDSLNQPRSSTISTLRDYLLAESKSKKDIELDKRLISGMKANQIPCQPNYSDCGLYLLAYVEKFVQDPDLCIRKILRKDMRTEEDWPTLKSGPLRSRLRQFMEQLYVEQEQLTKEEADQSNLMVDQQPISYLLGPSITDKVEKNVKDDKSPQVKADPPAELKSKESPRSREASVLSLTSPKPKNTDQDLGPAKAETQESVIYIEPVKSHTEPPPDVQKQSPRSRREVIEVPDSQNQGTIPAAEPVQIVDARVPKKSKKTRADTVYVGDSDGVEKKYATPRKEPSRGGRVEVQIQVNETPPGSSDSR